MTEQHYFTRTPETPSHEREITEVLRGKRYRFVTDAGVFSKDRVDLGTRILIEAMQLPSSGKILDLGCGYGPIGVVAADLAPNCFVCMVDVNERAAALAERNLALNGVENAAVYVGDGFSPVEEHRFSMILSNPPIRAGKKVIYPLMEEAKHRLVDGGRLCIVIRTKQGAKSMQKHLETVFGNLEILALESGYRVLQAVKRKEEPKES